MKLNHELLMKADERLREALEQAQGDEVLRAIVLLTAGDQRNEGERLEPDPRHFTSRKAYREELIACRRRQMVHSLKQTIEMLSALDLTTHGGEIGHTLVVEGTASRIAASLALPAVRHASLDRSIELIEPDLP